MLFPASIHGFASSFSPGKSIKRALPKRRLGVRVESRGFYRDVRGESLSHFRRAQRIKASAVKRRLGVRVESRGFYRDVRGESLSRSQLSLALGGAE